MEAVVDGGVEDESSVTRVKTCNEKLYNINIELGGNFICNFIFELKDLFVS